LHRFEGLKKNFNLGYELIYANLLPKTKGRIGEANLWQINSCFH
jgi:hypothetical protein